MNVVRVSLLDNWLIFRTHWPARGFSLPGAINCRVQFLSSERPSDREYFNTRNFNGVDRWRRFKLKELRSTESFYLAPPELEIYLRRGQGPTHDQRKLFQRFHSNSLSRRTGAARRDAAGIEKKRSNESAWSDAGFDYWHVPHRSAAFHFDVARRKSAKPESRAESPRICRRCDTDVRGETLRQKKPAGM